MQAIKENVTEETFLQSIYQNVKMGSSAIISLLPFKFNDTIEKAVDDTFEEGRRHVRQEYNRIESNLHKVHKAKQSPTPPPASTINNDVPEPVEDKEDPSRFMPK